MGMSESPTGVPPLGGPFRRRHSGMSRCGGARSLDTRKRARVGFSPDSLPEAWRAPPAIGTRSNNVSS